MSNLYLNPGTPAEGWRQREMRSAWIFCVVTVVLSVSMFFLLPGFAGVVIGVFIPTITAVVLIALTAGRGQVRARLFSAKALPLSIKWLLIGLGLGLPVPDSSSQPDGYQAAGQSSSAPL